MTKELLEYVLEVLRKTESGMHITIHQLTEGFKSKVTDEELFQLCEEVPKEAKKEGIYLEPIFAEDAIIGLPYSFDYMVKRKYSVSGLIKENCISVKYKTGGYMCCLPAVNSEITKAETASRAWDALIKTIFDECKVTSWYDTYVDHGILDGAYWELELAFCDGTVLCYGGSNKEPRGLKKLEKAVKPWSKDTIYVANFEED